MSTETLIFLDSTNYIKEKAGEYWIGAPWRNVTPYAGTFFHTEAEMEGMDTKMDLNDTWKFTNNTQHKYSKHKSYYFLPLPTNCQVVKKLQNHATLAEQSFLQN